jgi:hypothetical protein
MARNYLWKLDNLSLEPKTLDITVQKYKPPSIQSIEATPPQYSQKNN